MILFALVLMAGAVDPATPAPAPAPPGAASPAAAPTAAPAAVVAKVSNDDQVTCRRQAEPNSNIQKRVCLTNAQWKARQKEDQETVQDMQRQALRSTSSSSGAP